MKTDEHWKKIGLRHHHGIALPISALRTKKSCGIGEFYDLLPIIDWCASLKLDVIQLLPLNDTDGDPSPYNAVSSCAINPIYLSLSALPNSNEFDLAQFAPFLELSHINYSEVRERKYRWLYDYYQKYFVADDAFKQFVNENPWLEAYTSFKDQEHKQFHQYLQHLCFSQLKRVKAYATEKKVFLKGDIPILLSAQSADVLSEPDIFDLSLDAGAPPDFFNLDGQHWGFPLMNWDSIPMVETKTLHCRKFLSHLPNRPCGWPFPNLGHTKRRKAIARPFRSSQPRALGTTRTRNPRDDDRCHNHAPHRGRPRHCPR